MEEKKENKKLSYEELENAARQLSVQAEGIARENQQLKNALQQATLANMYTELGFKFRVIEHKDVFPKEFVDQCVNNIVEIMTPEAETTKSE